MASHIPLLGQDLLAARDSWFFEWFHLVRQAARRDTDGGRIRFTPQGKAFRRFVVLDVAVDAAGAIAALSLGLDRRFIDDPDDAPFARDIAQAFLRAALPHEAAAARALADEIAPPAEGEPPRADEPSDAGAVFLGAASEAVVEAGPARVVAANLTIDRHIWLLLSIEPLNPATRG